MIFTTIISAILLAAASFAAPIVGPQELIVVNPHIISPEEAVSWPMGSTQIVKWDTDKIPHGKALASGRIVLGYSTPDDINEHLDLDHPLASGFPLTDGKVKITIPKHIASRNDYFIVLFGDSGNTSPKFKIENLKV